MDEFVKKLPKEMKEIDDEDLRNMLALLVEFRGSDLEAIMGELETLVGLEYASYVQGSRAVKTGLETKSLGFSLKVSKAETLQWRIKHLVIKEYRDVDSKKAVELYEPLFDRILSKIDAKRECLVIFTTTMTQRLKFFVRRDTATTGFAMDSRMTRQSGKTFGIAQSLMILTLTQRSATSFCLRYTVPSTGCMSSPLTG